MRTTEEPWTTGAGAEPGEEDWVLEPGEVAELDTTVPHWFGSTGEAPGC